MTEYRVVANLGDRKLTAYAGHNPDEARAEKAAWEKHGWSVELQSCTVTRSPWRVVE